MQKSDIKLMPVIIRDDGSLKQLVQISVCDDIAMLGKELELDVKCDNYEDKAVVKYHSSEDGFSIYRGYIQLPHEDKQSAIKLTFLDKCSAEVLCGIPNIKNVDFVPITHHDLGYTDTIDVLLEKYCGYYDDILRFCDESSGYPCEAKYRYTVEQFWSLDYYLSHAGEEKIERLKKYVRDGRIEITATYSNIIDSDISSEEMVRLLTPSTRFASECGVKIKSAAQVRYARSERRNRQRVMSGENSVFIRRISSIFRLVGFRFQNVGGQASTDETLLLGREVILSMGTSVCV